MKTFKDLITDTDFAQVWEKFSIHYPNKMDRLEKFSSLYEKLRYALPVHNTTNMYIYIIVFQESTDGESICIKEFNEDDVSICFDVSGKDDEWTGYSIASSKFHKWLGYYIDENSLNTMTNESFIAHCLWEMTFYYGFDDTEVK
ncbi:DUF6557 family protein [Paenibacillus eucommiae]|uniref:Uncharacterized protein n=1 Tax=Paenibacillus eucommiae TaxID=1355755 RepID=A0ABS4JB32_9BACL|nr:DUF6557 family protein [Paenibacillus eucommiae]MBP1997020.1 hypothetical protein [Paenibacillus eucommiae]